MKKALLIAALALMAFGCNKQNQATTPVVQNKDFTYSFITGFEGYFDNVTVKLSYPESLFSIAANPKYNSEIDIKHLDSDQIDMIKFFYNGAAGFTDSADYWKNSKPCPDCQKIANNFTVTDGKDQITYANAKTEYVVFQHDPGFVILIMQKPLDNVLPVMQSLQITDVKTQPQP